MNMRKYRIVIFAIAAIMVMAVLVGCAERTINLTPHRVYLEAQKSYLNAWESYHKVWLALPETDPRKYEWAEKYHPKFIEAGELLSTLGKDPSDPANQSAFDAAMEAAENVLIELAIKKGGS